MMEEKRELRRIIRQKQQALSPQERTEVSARILAELEQLTEFKQARCVALYASLPDEVETQPFVEQWCSEKQILLPVMQGESLILRPFSHKAKLTKAAYGILEPTSGEEVPISAVELMVVPGMGFDPHGGRLGRGKGFYDRLLQGTSVYKIGVCFEFQLFPQLPLAPHDVRMDRIIAGSSRTVTHWKIPR